MQEEEIGVGDIGGTHARFALARVGGGRVLSLGPATVLRVADHISLAEAWRAFAARSPEARPRAAALAVASPVRGEELKFTNSPWRIRLADLPSELGVERLAVVNDFGAIGHAVAQLAPEHFAHVAGPRRPLPRPVIVTVVGPGTGLGVAIAVLGKNSHRIIETEGGHSAFAPRNAFEDGLAARLRARYGHVSVERVVSGPGLAEIRAALAGAETAPAPPDDKALWQAAVSGADPLSRQALERFCSCFGAFAGDAALLHGAEAIVLAGGLTERIAEHLPQTDFARSLTDKGRYETMLASLPVWRIIHPQPGLFGAAAAFAAQHN